MGKRTQDRRHPYLSGNFAPIHRVQPLTACKYSGNLPEELAGGEYVRNGGNPLINGSLDRDAHWFDGDGMLSGVAFSRYGEKGNLRPEFVNQYVLTDVFIASMTCSSLETPILPSIATLVSPLSSLITIILRILRTVILILLSHLPGSEQAIKRISVANTALLYHDGRALATCESGPPMRISLPSLETIGWYTGNNCEGESKTVGNSGFGGKGPLSFFKEWTTAHPRVDPKTSELLLYHSTFAPPYVRYSVISSSQKSSRDVPKIEVLNAPVAGMRSAKMMHDFGVSSTHTIIMDLPLSLDPLNLAKNKPVVAYDPNSVSRFGVFPRHEPHNVRWFETNPCCIFHTANSWNSAVENPVSKVQCGTVNMLACRLTSASLVFSAGDLAAPIPTEVPSKYDKEEEQCRLYYYEFQPDNPSGPDSTDTCQEHHVILNQWALCALPFEFPSMRDSHSMTAAKFIYGCSVEGSSFGAALGRAVKIDSLVKVDVETLISRGRADPPPQVTGCVDNRTISEILGSEDLMEPIKVFKMPPGWYAQESRFVPRSNGNSEDDGWLLSYVFDESQLGDDGECLDSARSELWVIDARSMSEVVARIYLPQRVPYGLHGNWFSEDQILGQRSVTQIRQVPQYSAQIHYGSPAWRLWMGTRRFLQWCLK